MRLRAATRASPLARWQTDHVAGLLDSASRLLGEGRVTVEPVIVSTVGDRRATVPIQQMSGKGVFVKEVQAAVLDGRADIAVHSAKDMPSVTPAELTLAAVLRRADPRDALVGGRLAELPPGAVVATGSPRRRALLAGVRPDLAFAELRGNIATRIRRAADFHAIVMAVAALDRLGVKPEVLDVLPPKIFVPQAGQGAIAVECRADDLDSRAILAGIEHAPTRRAVDAERAFLAELGGDCNLPASAHAVPVVSEDDSHQGDGNRLELIGLLASPDGQIVLRSTRRGVDPCALGRAVARALIDSDSGAVLLANWR